jgi:hypothetical protein
VTDGNGDIYIAGETEGGLPGQTSSGGADVYLQKYNGSGERIWSRQWGTEADDAVLGLAIDSSGNLYLVGSTQAAWPGQSPAGGSDAYVQKHNSNGAILWTRQFGTASNDSATKAAIDPGGNLYVVGMTEEALPGQESSGEADAFVRKYDSGGIELWTRQFGSGGDDVAWGAATDGAGNVYVAGVTSGGLSGMGSLGSNDGFLTKFNLSGGQLWVRQFGTPSDDQSEWLVVDDQDNLYTGGYTDGTLPGQQSAGGRDALVRKFNNNGAEIWTRQFGVAEGDELKGAATDSLGNLYVVGFTEGAFNGHTHAGSRDVLVRKYNRIGSVISTVQFGSGGEDVSRGVAVDSQGSLYIVGTVSGSLPGQDHLGSQDAYLIKLFQGP